ncbi:MAG TPA: FAD-binding oxidoreductase [Alphaproteobacteria bacterium]|nr:FAD-binding oxidoreductase [Alphaproteobacteria bacterium]
MGALISYNDRRIRLEDGESVLDGLLREDQIVPHSCKAGICQSCLMSAARGDIPETAQLGLKPTYKRQGLFLACRCVPDADLTVQLPDAAGLSTSAIVVEKNDLNDAVLQLRLRPTADFDCRPGQYLTLMNPDQIARSYSIANQPAIDGYIELHIRIVPNGAMSGWLRETAGIGDHVTIRGPAGDCFYAADGDGDYPVILAGTGTGLAPLYGIVADALAQGHSGDIRLFHGALQYEDLYFVEDLTELAAGHENFSYQPCVLNGGDSPLYRQGNVEDIVIASLPESKAATRLYLCGAPELVNSLKRKAFLAGLASKHIFADAFLPSKA